MIGYGSKSLRVGDELYLVLGLHVLAALRPVAGGHRFVGLCYVQGLMYGEGLHPSRRPQSRYYPGSSTADEYWMIDPSELVREKRTAVPPRWEQLESRAEAFEYFRLSIPELFAKGYIQDPSWSPVGIEFGEQSMWLMEIGYDPVPIITEEITLV
jgi:hypothetical protein